MKLLLIKIAIIVLCVPAYPVLIFGMYAEANSYLGEKSTLSEVSKSYWEDVKDAIIHKE